MALLERPGELVTKRELLERVWPKTTVEEGTLRVHITLLRKALGDGQHGVRYIENLSGLGYRFIAPVTRVDEPEIQQKRLERSALMPPRLAHMQGRDAVVAEVSERLLQERFVTVVGPGGMGKTTVAIAVAHTVAPEFGGDVVFCDLESVADSSLLATTLASYLGATVPEEDLVPALLAFLRTRQLLLVFDNCEHVIESIAPLAARIFTVAPQVHLLTTSREALRVEGEHIYFLPPLATPSGLDLSAAEALTYPAVQLFMERAAAAGGGFELTDIDAPVIAAVSRKLDGIPLALELAASRVSALGIRGIDELLNSRLEFPWPARRTLPSRHQTLEALLDWSYNLLTPVQQVVLRRLSIFVGSFTLHGAQCVLSESGVSVDDSISSIVNLVDKSLLSATAHEGSAQYRLLETTRAYGLARLARHDETEAMARCHARYFANLFRSAQEPPIHSEALQNLGNVRAALEWSFSGSGDSELGIDLILAVAPTLLSLSWLPECRRWSARALAVLPRHAHGSARELDLLELLAGSAMFAHGNAHEVRAAIRRALVLARRLGNPRRELDLLAMLNVFLGRIGEFEQALSIARQSALAAKATADEGAMAVSEWMLGTAHHLIGDQGAAQAHCDAGCAHDAAARGRRHDIFGYDHRVRALVVRSRTLWLRGFPEQAGRVAREAIDAAEGLNQPVTACLSLIYTAPVFLWSGDLSSAERAVSQLLEQARQHSLKPFQTVGRGLLGKLLVDRGQRDAGIELLLDAVEALDEEQHLIQVPEFRTYIAEALRDESGRALASIDRAIVERARSGSSFDMPEILRVKGLILLGASDAKRTVGFAQLARSLELAQVQGSLSWALRTATSIVQMDAGNRAARRTLAQIYGRFTEGFDGPDLQAAQRLLRPSRRGRTVP